MKSLFALLVACCVTTEVAMAQITASLGGLVGYYDPDLGNIHQLLEDVKAQGGTVQSRPEGDITFGLTFDFSMTERVNMRLDAALWSGSASWRDAGGTGARSTLEIDAMPVMVGFLLWMNDRTLAQRIYLGASVGIIRTSLKIRSDQAQSSIFNASFLESTGSAFAFRPLAGIDYRLVSALRIFLELSYLYGSFTPQEIDLIKTQIGKEAVTLDGFDLMAGLKFTF